MSCRLEAFVVGALKGLRDVGGRGPSGGASLPSWEDPHWSSPLVSMTQPRPQRESSLGPESARWGWFWKRGTSDSQSRPRGPSDAPPSPNHAALSQHSPVKVTTEGSGDGPSWAGGCEQSPCLSRSLPCPQCLAPDPCPHPHVTDG